MQPEQFFPSHTFTLMVLSVVALCVAALVAAILARRAVAAHGRTLGTRSLTFAAAVTKYAALLAVVAIVAGYFSGFDGQLRWKTDGGNRIEIPVFSAMARREIQDNERQEETVWYANFVSRGLMSVEEARAVGVEVGDVAVDAATPGNQRVLMEAKP